MAIDEDFEAEQEMLELINPEAFANKKVFSQSNDESANEDETTDATNMRKPEQDSAKPDGQSSTQASSAMPGALMTPND